MTRNLTFIILFVGLAVGIAYAGQNVIIPRPGTYDYFHYLPCADNEADTVVTDRGTSGAWTATVNTNALYDATERCFSMNANTDELRANDNITFEKLQIRWHEKYHQADCLTEETKFFFSDDDDDETNLDANEFFLKRLAYDQWEFRARGNADADQAWIISTDYGSQDTLWHVYKLTLDASQAPWTVDLQQCDAGGENCVSVTWGAWQNDSPSIAVFNNPLQVGFGVWEPESYLKNITVEDQT